jgi:hypothetical protein
MNEPAPIAGRLHYVGDEIGAAGWRLAGAVVHVPAAGREGAALAAALAVGRLVLISAAAAARLDAGELRRALAGSARGAALALVVPDPQGLAALPDLASRLRAELGMAESAESAR